jgi:hypothetical protein
MAKQLQGENIERLERDCAHWHHWNMLLRYILHKSPDTAKLGEQGRRRAMSVAPYRHPTAALSAACYPFAPCGAAKGTLLQAYGWATRWLLGLQH